MLTDRLPWVLLAVAIVVALWFPFKLGWDKMWHDPAHPEGYEPIVPLAAAALAWFRRDHLKLMWQEANKREGPIWLLAIGCLLLVISHVSRMQTSSMVAVICIVAGTVLRLYGPAVTRAARGPLLFLLFLLPLPNSIIDQSTQTLQLNSTQAAANVIDMFGYHPTVEGTTIKLPKYEVRVTRACSGVSILAPLVVMTVWLLLIFESTIVQRILLLTSCVLLALVMNIARISAMGLIGVHSPKLADTLHDANGWLFTLIAFALNFALCRLIGIRKPCVPL
jgi:exosortase